MPEMLRRLLAFFGIVEGGCGDLECDDCAQEWGRRD